MTGLINAAGDPTLLAHGVGSREDLPLPLTYTLVGAAIALVVSFAALGAFWRSPRLTRVAGPPLPGPVSRVAASRAFGLALRALGILAAAWVGTAAVFGRDDALNPTAGSVFVLLWIGVPLLSVLVGPLWKALNPLRGLHTLVARGIGTKPDEGIARLSPRVGVWPAAATLLAFVWLELVAPENTSLPVLRTFLAAWAALHLIAASWYGSRWFAAGDGFEVFSTLLGRLAPIGPVRDPATASSRRRPATHIAWRSPLASLANTPPVPGMFAVVGVLLGSTAFDSLSNSPWWVRTLQDSPLSTTATGTLGLLAVVLAVTLVFAAAAAAAAGPAGMGATAVAAHFAPSLVPIVVGYFVAHYWSLLIFIGQQTVIQLSDPLGNGEDLLGLSDRGIDDTLAEPGFVAALQVGAIVTGHVLAVFLAHEKALQLMPARRVLTAQLPMLVVMVAYTIGGLSLLFAT